MWSGMTMNGGEAVPELSEYYAFRQQLVDAIRTDVVGPKEPNEIILDPPITAYISGILFPQNAGYIAPEHDVDESEDYDEVVLPDPPVAMAHTRYPSSMGMTFSVDVGRSDSIRVEVSAARYEEHEEEEDSSGDSEGVDGANDDDAKPKSRSRRIVAEKWKRVPLEIAATTIGVTQPLSNHRVELADGLELFCRVRKGNSQGRVPVTLVLLNRLVVKQGLKDPSTFFQPRITVRAGSDSSHSGCFVDRPPAGNPSSDEDLRSYQLLYRHAHNFAMGHGCSVQWNPASDARTDKIWTEYVPEYELLLSDSNPNIDGRFLSLLFLVEAERGEVASGLGELCSGYERWISDRRGEVAGLPADLQSVATLHLDACTDAVTRMRGGIALIGSNDRAWEAFRLANRAMLAQRARTDWMRRGRPEEGPGDGGDQQWRPFQLAFILLCLKSIANREDPEREIADLLWFPTGGGKTEAYLGLIAFTLFLRRLNDSSASGVAVIMRYTLRLLTIQQFERASMLICSCESIRRTRDDLGSEPFRIGLWVGEGGTPNSIGRASKSLDKLRQGVELQDANPVQLHACPWCGVALDHKNYYVSGSVPKKLIISCRTQECEFRDGLPVDVVDENIYQSRPSLIISTVDKFAALPWNSDVGSIFNLETTDPPPELVIQDELHLISGPLGTLTGLYETAVDHLCSRKGAKPKVIASTATIRRAGQQAAALFDRELRQFPPPGVDARDSYFAVEADRLEKGTRLYLGLMAPGSSQTTLLVRTYADVLQKAADLVADPRIKDPYWTLVGYFNSLRVLGGARMQVQDDVSDRMELLATGSGTTHRALDNRIELTSREPSGNIPDHLRRMAIEHPDESALDVILATNMISVGVDVDRLGLMAVMGQPQSTSEYIQGTSRVGRKYPGLVLALLNASRSRDRSHYESFSAFHSALYRQVESTSVTPFSSRARDRGLHAVLIALSRLLVSGLKENRDAQDVTNFSSEIEAIRDVILKRVERIALDELDATGRQLEEILEQWKELVSEQPGLVFANYKHPDKALLVDAGRESIEEGFETTRSLRDVDLASNLYLVKL